jgi:hypothetical protein
MYSFHAWNRLSTNKERGVIFRGESRDMGQITAVLFEDICGNLFNPEYLCPRKDRISARRLYGSELLLGQNDYL